MHWRPLNLATVQPLVIVLRRENSRHAIVDLLRDCIRVRGDDGEALQPTPVRALPSVSEASEAKGLRLPQIEAEGRAFGLLPLVIARDGDNATVAMQRPVPK